MTPIVPEMPPEVAAVFARFPAPARSGLLAIRQLIFETAAATEVGPLTETLKWGEPAYLTETTKSGSTIRVGVPRKAPGHYAVYFNCQTDLIETARAQFSDRLAFDGNRAILIRDTAPVPMAALGICLSAALTYHRRKRAAGNHG